MGIAKILPRGRYIDISHDRGPSGRVLILERGGVARTDETQSSKFHVKL